MAAVPSLEFLKTVLLTPRTECAACDVKAEVERRREAFEARHGAAALLQLKEGKGTPCKHGRHMWTVVGDAFACVLCATVKK